MARDSSGHGQERFAGLLLRYRLRARLTQRELAIRAGVNMRTVQGWETGVMYPAAERLQTLLASLLEAGGFNSGHELEEAQELWAAVEHEAPRAHPAFERDWFLAQLAERRGTRPTPAAAAPAAHTAPEPDNDRHFDWGDAPTVADFVGRTTELSQAREWVVDDACRLLGVLGMGGIGKTSVAARIAQDVSPNFERVYWRGLRNAPSVAEWMAGAIAFLSDQQQVAPDGQSNQRNALLQLLRHRRSLLVLDNYETLLEPAQRDGRYRDSMAGYGELLQAVGSSSHQSCMIFTSREAPPDWTVLSGGGVRTLELGGLGPREGRALLAHKELQGGDEEWSSLVARYGGNGLALKVVGESIRQVFGGDIGSFLAESTSGAVFGGIRRLLAEQFERGSDLEQALLNVLAVEREPLTVAELVAELGPRVSRGALVETIEALRQRSLVERAETAGAAAFTLQSVVLEYVTERLVETVIQEIESGSPNHLVAQPLIKAQAKEFVLQSQQRLIGEPILQHLKAQHGAYGAELLLQRLLDDWRERPAVEQAFGPGNVVNLLRILRGDLRGLDLSHLALRQAYLAGVEAEDVSLAYASLSQATLTETFNYPLSVSFSRDGALLAAGTAGGEVCLWRVADRTPLLVLQGHAGPVHRVALSEDGQLLASASEDGSIRLWRAPDGLPLGTLAGHTTPVYALTLSSSARLLVSGSFDGTLQVWDVPRQELVATLQGHASPVWSVSLSADASVLASGSFDGSIQLWDVESRRLMSALGEQGSPIWSLRLRADGKVLVSGSEDGLVRLWDVQAGKLSGTLQGHTGSVRGVALSADGRVLASAGWDGTVRLWDAIEGRPVAVVEGHAGPVRAVVLNTDGQLLASASLDGSVRLWEASTGRPLATFAGHTSPVYGVALNAEGTLLASGGWDGTVDLWNTSDGAKLATLSGHASPVYGVALSGDGQVVASASWDRTSRVWHTNNRQAVATLMGHTGGVRSVALNVDGSVLASGSWDGTVRLWHTPDARPVTTLRGHSGGVRSVAVDGDGGVVASGSLDGTVRLWRTSDGVSLATLNGHDNPVYCVALSADGAVVAGGSWDGTLRVWDGRTTEILATLSGHSGEVRGVALSSDGRLLASGGLDTQIRLWDVRAGRLLQTLTGHTSPVYGVAMSRDGSLIASGSFDGTVRVWAVSSGTCLRVLRSDRPYERMDITGLTGVTEAQRGAMLTLGAVER
jgi:WD40 repeat protein/transcriptional regulator with XRE-family HTH domain